MNLFGNVKELPVKNETPPTPQSVRSRFTIMLEHMDQAHFHLGKVAYLCSTLIMDVEKGLKYIDRMRTDVTEALGNDEQIGRQVENDVKQAIDDEFIPPKYREPK